MPVDRSIGYNEGNRTAFVIRLKKFIVFYYLFIRYRTGNFFVAGIGSITLRGDPGPVIIRILDSDPFFHRFPNRLYLDAKGFVFSWHRERR
jgi:hypothetical protein